LETEIEIVTCISLETQYLRRDLFVKKIDKVLKGEDPRQPGEVHHFINSFEIYFVTLAQLLLLVCIFNIYLCFISVYVRCSSEFSLTLEEGITIRSLNERF
jgi:hypothetical protein